MKGKKANQLKLLISAASEENLILSFKTKNRTDLLNYIDNVPVKDLTEYIKARHELLRKRLRTQDIVGFCGNQKEYEALHVTGHYPHTGQVLNVRDQTVIVQDSYPDDRYEIPTHWLKKGEGWVEEWPDPNHPFQTEYHIQSYEKDLTLIHMAENLLHVRLETISTHSSVQVRKDTPSSPVVYILTAANIKPKTEEDVKREFEITKLQHPVWKRKSFAEFWNWKTEIFETKYQTETYDTAYFLDEETAVRYAKENMADINEAGAYPYLLIHTKETNHMYADTETSRVRLFAYTGKDAYEEITDLDEKKEYSYLIHAVDYTQTPPAEKRKAI